MAVCGLGGAMIMVNLATTRKKKQAQTSKNNIGYAEIKTATAPPVLAPTPDAGSASVPIPEN